MRVLSARARALNARAGAGGLPALFLVTDPDRMPDPIASARALPRGSAIIYRPFGAAGRLTVAKALARLAQRRGIILLIGEDERLAVRARAGGLHLAERSIGRIRAVRRRHPSWLITAAAHAPPAIAAAALQGADGVLISPVFTTESHPDAPPLGARTAAAWAATAGLPAIALGGINGRTIMTLRGRFAGIAAMGALMAAKVRI